MCTGSSIMPQKKNYDVLEILRANYSVLFSKTVLLASSSNNLVSGYNRDVQLNKPALMDSFGIALSSLKVCKKIIKNLQVHEEKMKSALSTELFAAKEATELSLLGVPFRDAYRKVSAKFG